MKKILSGIMAGLMAVSLCGCFGGYESDSISGHLGVGWVVVEYEYNDRPYGYNDLEDMKEAINCAEKNLLAIGMPFQDDKCFHGSKEEITEKIKRNNELREQWELEEIEKTYWNEYEKNETRRNN